MNYPSILVDSKNGTLSCFAKNISGTILGLGSAHVLFGDNGFKDISVDPDLIKIYDDEAEALIVCGQLTDGCLRKKSSSLHNPNVMDAGIFTYNTTVANKLEPQLKRLLLHPDTFNAQDELIGCKVKARSGPRKKWLNGTISGVNQNGYDFVITADAGEGFTHGDSGMLWLDDSGNAVAIHTAGVKNSTSANPSEYSYSINISRVVSEFNIKLYKRTEEYA